MIWYVALLIVALVVGMAWVLWHSGEGSGPLLKGCQQDAIPCCNGCCCTCGSNFPFPCECHEERPPTPDHFRCTCGNTQFHRGPEGGWATTLVCADCGRRYSASPSGISLSASNDNRAVFEGRSDSPRWCEKCQRYGDHHTDRHRFEDEPVVERQITEEVRQAAQVLLNRLDEWDRYLISIDVQPEGRGVAPVSEAIGHLRSALSR